MKQLFQVRMPQEVICGEGTIQHLEKIGRRHQKAVIFTDKGVHAAGLTEEPRRLLEQGGCKVKVINGIPAEPSYGQVQEIMDQFLEEQADVIIAIGGGSVMDTAKLASMAVKGEKIQDYVDNPLLGKKRTQSVMIPTTAGTGSEATPNSIVLVPEQGLKVGIVNPEMIADIVILDGNMIRRLPLKIAASTGIDALAHSIECFTSNKANDFSNMYALAALKLIFRNLVEACTNADNIEAKNKMLLAAFYGGVAITASGTTAVHALSYPLGGKYHIAHGVANAILLTPVMRFNKDACLDEFSVVYDEVCGRGNLGKEEKAEWVIREMESMVKKLEIPQNLNSFGVNKDDLEDLVNAGLQVKRLLNNNKKTVTAEDARAIYSQVM